MDIFLKNIVIARRLRDEAILELLGKPILTIKKLATFSNNQCNFHLGTFEQFWVVF